MSDTYGYDDAYDDTAATGYADDSTDPDVAQAKSGSKKSSRPPDEFVALGYWVDVWLAPAIARKLDGAGKGLTWCGYWWQHREVAMRMYALWRAWEAARTGDDKAMSSWWVHHADPHLRVVLDGETGPLFRCTNGHVEPQRLHVVAAPDVWFGPNLDPDPSTRRRCAYLPGPEPAPAQDDSDEQPRGEVFASVVEWVEVWLAPVIARKLVGHGKGLTWCGQWWRHREPAIRLHALWRAWEAAVAEGELALSGWWVGSLDPHLRALLDGEHGPMYKCTATSHTDVAALGTVAVPDGWFDDYPRVGSNPQCDPFGGFGPDVRALSAQGVA